MRVALIADAHIDGPGGEPEPLVAQLRALLSDRPLAVETPAPGLTALTNRMIGYLDARA